MNKPIIISEEMSKRIDRRAIGLRSGFITEDHPLAPPKGSYVSSAEDDGDSGNNTYLVDKYGAGPVAQQRAIADKIKDVQNTVPQIEKQNVIDI